MSDLLDLVLLLFISALTPFALLGYLTYRRLSKQNDNISKGRVE